MRYRSLGRRWFLKHLAVGAYFTGIGGRKWQAGEARVARPQRADLGKEGASPSKGSSHPSRDLRWVSDRVELSELGRAQEFAYLLEPGREGVFGWVDEDAAAQVSADALQGIFVGPRSDPTGSSGAWVRLAHDTVALQIVWFGAKFDLSEVTDIHAATDDTAAWKAALTYLRSVGGGQIVLPPGVSRVTEMIDIPVDVPIHIVGSGQRKNYPDDLTADTKPPSTVMPDHSGRCAFRLVAAVDGNGGFTAEHWNVATLLTSANQSESAAIPDCAFGWDCANAFYYGATFRNIGVSGFRKSGAGSAFDVYRSDTAGIAAGAVLVEDCHINFNNWIWRNLDDTYMNGLRFVYNKAGKNGRRPGRGGISAAGANIGINDNVLEDNYNAIYLGGPHASVEVKGNYFEANTGGAIIEIREAYNVRIGPNNYTTMDYGNLDHKVLLYVCQNVDCVDPYWSQLTIKANPPVIGNRARNRLKDGAKLGVFARCDDFNGKSWSLPPSFDTKHQGIAATGVVRELDPQYGQAFSAESYTTTGSGSLTYSVSDVLAGDIGDWLVMCWLIKRTGPGPDDPSDPYIRLSFNSSEQTKDFNLYTYTAWFAQGEWSLITVAARLEVAISGTVTALCWPYGINPDAGLTSSHNWPVFYTVDDVNKVRPFLDNLTTRQISAASKNWQLGSG